MTIMIGKTFGRWLVLEQPKAKHHYCLCRCQCGTERTVRANQLVIGRSRSCGCLKKEVAAEQIKRLSTTHGMANKTRTYSVWKGMRKRCGNPQCKSFKNYGGRGIKVCPRWDSFENFLSDMGECPPKMSIDRKNNDGDYTPNNCHWTDFVTQMNNTRTNVLIRFNSKTMTVKQWSRELGIPYHRIYQRLFRLSWSVKRAFEL